MKSKHGDNTKKTKRNLLIISSAIIVIIIIILFIVLKGNKNIKGKYSSILSDAIITTIEFTPDKSDNKTGICKISQIIGDKEFEGDEVIYKQEGKEITFVDNRKEGIFGKGTSSPLDMYDEKLIIDGNYLVEEDSSYDGEVPNSKTFDAEIKSKYDTYEFKKDGTLLINSEEQTTYERKGNIISYKYLLNDGVTEKEAKLYIYEGKVYDTAYEKQ